MFDCRLLWFWGLVVLALPLAGVPMKAGAQGARWALPDSGETPAQLQPRQNPDDTCWEVRRTWVPAHANPPGRYPRYMPGHWRYDRVQVPCSQARKPCDQPTLGRDQFAQATQLIASRRFEASRVSAVLEVIEGNCLLSVQVLGMLQLLEYEESRFRLARHAFPYVADPQNYDVVGKAMRVPLSQQAFRRFVVRVRGY